MKPPLLTATQDRAMCAQCVLDAAEDSLEHITKQIRKRCTQELAFIAKSGIFPTGTQLHALLTIIALNLKLDSGALESLNSMIKSNMSLGGNRISLELLSSRVNARKTCTLLTGGSTKLRDVRPVMENLAKSAFLHEGYENDILSYTYRWTPPEPSQNMTSNEPHVYEPGLRLSSDQKWAVRYHRLLMQFLKQSTQSARKQTMKGATCVQSVRFVSNGFTPSEIEQTYIVSELTGRSCQLLQVHHPARASCSDLDVIELPHTLTFHSSIDVIAGFRRKLMETKGTTVSAYMSHVTLSTNTSRIVIGTTSGLLMFRFQSRKEYTRKQPSSSQPVIPNSSEVDKLLDNENIDGDDNDTDLQHKLDIQEAMLLG